VCGQDFGRGSAEENLVTALPDLLDFITASADEPLRSSFVRSEDLLRDIWKSEGASSENDAAVDLPSHLPGHVPSEGNKYVFTS
jgi:hypothetical protein